MAIARIITRSEACSRELAVHLQSRGYVVETVSPDNIPSNPADLELRVETGSGDRLTASVVARDGDRSSTLEFVRELRSPITPSTATELTEKQVAAVEILAGPIVKPVSERLAEGRVDRYAERTPPVAIREETPMPSFASGSSEISVPVTPALTRWRPIRPVGPQSLSARPAETGVADAKPADVKHVEVAAVPTGASAVLVPEAVVPTVDPTIPVVPVGEPGSDIPQAFPYHTFDRAPSLFGNAVLVMIGMALLITLVVGFSLYRSKESLSNRDKVPPSGATSASDAKDVGNHSAAESPSTGAPAVTPATKSAPASKPAPDAKGVEEPKESNSRSLSQSRGIGHSAGGEDDLVAKDSVVYFDQRAKPAKSRPPVANTRSRAHRDGVVAENTVTYFNGTTGPLKSTK